MFKNETTAVAQAPDRETGPWLWGAGLGAEHGAVAGLGYALSFALVALLLGLGDGLDDALALAGVVLLCVGVVAAVVGALLGTLCGALVALAAPRTPVGLGARAAWVLVGALVLVVALVATFSGADPWVVVVGSMLVVGWPAVFAVPALLLHARAVSRRVHGTAS